jgi:prepilin-type N-terminal cleavage/methylation domain-containing protein
MRNRRAMSLLELLIAIVIMGVVMGAAMNFFIGQSKSFRRGASDVTLLQNLRFGADLLNQHFRSVGANTIAGQPPVIYADANSFSFNADYASNTAGDHNAIYYTPNAPNTEVNAITVSNQITVPGGSSLVYPNFDYKIDSVNMSSAEMITFWFAPDTETARSDDYVLFRQVNNSPPEAVVRNILQDTVPFFQYLYLSDSANLKSIDTVKSGNLPLEFDFTSDTTKTRLITNLRAVIVSYIVTNGLTGPAERTRPMSLIAPFPNMGDRELETCGNDPVAMSAPTISSTDSLNVTVQWTADGDETSGERDIMSYLLWRRRVGDSVWNSPFVSIPSGNPPTYTFLDAPPQDAAADVAWQYAVAAQDCTPSYSGAVVSAGVVWIKKAP